MTQPDDLEPPDEPITIAYPIGSLVHLADLLGEIDEFLRSGTNVTDLLTAFMTRRGPHPPGLSSLQPDRRPELHHPPHPPSHRQRPGERTRPGRKPLGP